MISLGELFSKKPAPMLGLDISSSSIKMVELDRSATGQLVLKHCALVPLERGWIVGGQIENFEEVTNALRLLLQKSGSKTQNVALALPASTVITKLIHVSSDLSGPELEFQVESEASQYLPFPLEDASLDFCIVGPSQISIGDTDVFIAASRRERVQGMKDLTEAAGLHPTIVDVDSLASRLALNRLLQSYPQQGAGIVVALFEIGVLTTSMQIICDDEVLYERDQAFGGYQLTEMIQRQYGFSEEEAEAKKRNADLPDDYETLVLQPFVESISQEIGRSLKFFFTSTLHHEVDYVMLAGGSAAVTGLTQAVTAHTDFSCNLVNPFEGMEMGGSIPLKSMAREAPAFLTSCGLALRRFQP